MQASFEIIKAMSRFQKLAVLFMVPWFYLNTYFAQLDFNRIHHRDRVCIQSL